MRDFSLFELVVPLDPLVLEVLADLVLLFVVLLDVGEVHAHVLLLLLLLLLVWKQW